MPAEYLVSGLFRDQEGLRENFAHAVRFSSNTCAPTDIRENTDTIQLVSRPTSAKSIWQKALWRQTNLHRKSLVSS